MGTVLTIVDVLVLLSIVISVSRAVRNGQPRGTGPLILFICMVVAVLIFAAVSFTAASGLAQSSLFNQVALLLFLVATAVMARVSWGNV